MAFFGPAFDAARETTGDSATAMIADQFVDAALLPFATPAVSWHWHPAAPIIGLPVAVLAALGVAVATAAIGHRRYASSLWRGGCRCSAWG